MELKTPLYDAHVKAGGKIVPFAGCSYGNCKTWRYGIRRDSPEPS